MKKTLIAITVAVVLCILLLLGAQWLLHPEYPEAGGLGAKGFFSLEENSVDVLFLGSSQVYCGVDTVKMTQVYGIPAYTLAASAQEVPMTEYYLQEALKTQHPKTVFVDVYSIYADIPPAGEGVISWSFDTMPDTPEKEEALKRYYPNDRERWNYIHYPLLRWRSRLFTGTFWQQLPQKWESAEQAAKGRGFMPTTPLEPQTFPYLGEDDGPIRTINPAAAESFLRMADICQKENIRLVLFKTPSPWWTRSDSTVVRAFAAENGLTFIDLSDHITDMGLDGAADTYGITHLSAAGAEKVTDYLYNHYLYLLQ